MVTLPLYGAPMGASKILIAPEVIPNANDAAEQA